MDSRKCPIRRRNHSTAASVANSALWYRILRFDKFPQFMTRAESKNSIQVIERMTRLLDALADSPAPASLKHLAQSAALHPSTAHRILTAMVNERMSSAPSREATAWHAPDRTRQPGQSRVSVRELALPFMRELHAAIGEASTCRCGARMRSYTSSAPPAAAR